MARTITGGAVRRRVRTMLLAAVAVVPTVESGALAEIDPAAHGLEIFQRADDLASGYVDMQVDLEMVLRTRNGRASKRALSIKQLEVDDDGDKTLVVFATPKTIEGTALLSFAHKVGSDDQWLFLPAIKRVKKIASKNKSGPFLGSEFTYEDLATSEVEQYTYRWLRDERCGERRCFVVSRVPVDEHSGYAEQIVWLDQPHHRVVRIEYSDRRGELLKTLTVSGYQQYAGRLWKPDRMRMDNHRTGRSTELFWFNYRFATGLQADRDFTTNALRRIR